MDILTSMENNVGATYDFAKTERISKAIKELGLAKSRIEDINEEPNDLLDISNNIDSMIAQLTLLQQSISCDVETPTEEPTTETPPVVIPPIVTPPIEVPPVVVPPVVTPPATTIRFAPVQPPVTANIDLACISLNWQDKQGPTLGQMTNVANHIANTYANMSNGAVKFNTLAKVVNVNLAHKPSNLAEAEKQAKAAVNTGRKKPFDMYMIVHSNVRSYSNANGGVGHLKSTLIRTALHETGHLKPFSLTHTGSYDAKGVYQQYADCSSFMGSCSTFNLNAPQMWALGWLPKNKVAQYELTDPTMEYKLEPLSTTKATSAVKAIRIPLKDEDLFLSAYSASYANNKLILHNRVNRGTKRVIPLFNNKAEYKGLIFERIAINGAESTIRVSQNSTATTTPTKK